MITNNIQVPVQQTPTNAELLARINELNARVDKLKSRRNLFNIFLAVRNFVDIHQSNILKCVL